MANQEGSPNNCVFVETNFNTRLVLTVHNNEIISDFKEKLCKEHKELFPQTGEINISAMKVKRFRQFYHLPDSMIISMAYEGLTKTWFMYADVVRVEGERLAIMDVDPSDSYPKETLTGSEGCLEVGLKTEAKKEKKRKVESSGGNKSRKKPTIDLNLSAAITASRSDVDEGNVKVEVVSSEICAVSPRGKMDDILTGAIGKGAESGMRNGISVEENHQTSEADNPQTVELVSNPENQLGTNSNMITSLSTEKKKKRKKSSRENEMVKKIDDNVGGGKAIPTAADSIQTGNFVSDLENQMDATAVLATGPSTKKKRKHKKSLKDQINHSTADTTTTSKTVNEREKVSGSIGCVDVSSESFPQLRGEKLADTLVDAGQAENDMGVKFVDNVGLTNNLQVADLASTPVQESKMLDHIGKLKDEYKILEHEAAKDNSDINAGEANSIKTTKKKKSKRSKSPAKEDTPVASGAHNVEPLVKVVDGEEPDRVIRNVLDSLQQKNENGENWGKTGKKSSKKSKKKDSLNMVDSRVLSVDINNTAHQEVPFISNPKDNNVLFTPTKKDTERHLEKNIADNSVDNNPSKQILGKTADMGDNFGSSQKDTVVGGGKKQDQVTDVVESEKEKKSLDLHPAGSIDGSMSSIKTKERNCRVQPTSLGSSHLQSRAKSDHNGSKVDCFDASIEGAVDNKKEAVRTSSNSVKVNKSAMNFFKNAEWDSTEDKSNKTASDVSTKSPSDSSSDGDSDVTSMSRKQAGNILTGGTNKFSGSLQDILRSSRSFKMAKLRASQSQPGLLDDDSPTLDCVPDSQAN